MKQSTNDDVLRKLELGYQKLDKKLDEIDEKLSNLGG